MLQGKWYSEKENSRESNYRFPCHFASGEGCDMVYGMKVVSDGYVGKLDSSISKSEKPGS